MLQRESENSMSASSVRKYIPVGFMENYGSTSLIAKLELTGHGWWTVVLTDGTAPFRRRCHFVG